MSALDFLHDELAALVTASRLRVPVVVEAVDGPVLRIDGRELLSFSSNDYLGLSGNRTIVAVATAALARWGAGAGASRLVTGNTAEHAHAEQALARLVGAPSARLFVSGYAANAGVLPVLASAPEDELFSDELNHASLIDGCRLARARVRRFPHGDAGALEELLRRSSARRKVVVTESVFSMDGDRAPLAALREVCTRYGAVFVVDEAHSAGVFGAGGGGVLQELGVGADVTIVTGGKALGAAGGAVCGPAVLSDVLWNRARTLVFSTGCPPSTAAALSAAVELVMSADGAERRSVLWRRVRQLTSGLEGLGIGVSGGSPIIPLVVGDDGETMRWSAALRQRGLFVQGIRPPTVPVGTARLRLVVTAAHTEEQVARLVEALAGCLASGLRLAGR